MVDFNQFDVPYGWDFLLENVLDPAHLAVSHHGQQGASRSAPPEVFHKN